MSWLHGEYWGNERPGYMEYIEVMNKLMILTSYQISLTS